VEAQGHAAGQHASIFFDFYPFDMVGWKGNLSLFKLNMCDIRSLASEGVHLPPAAHGTFQGPGLHARPASAAPRIQTR